MRKLISLINSIFFCHVLYSQSAYMHEAQEDSGNPITGLLGFILLGCIVYFVSSINDSCKERRKIKEINKIKIKIKEEEALKMEQYKEWRRKTAIPTPIDLGLSVYWADFNLGSYKSTDLGDRYCWAEIHLPNADNNYDYQDVKLESLGNISANPKYDVATYQLKDKWRIPTPIECRELLDLCKWEFQIIDGVQGCKITGPNKNSIFLPYNYMNCILKKYTSAHYWTSYPSDRFKDSAMDLRFGENCKKPAEIWSASGRQRFCIRPVKDK